MTAATHDPEVGEQLDAILTEIDAMRLEGCKTLWREVYAATIGAGGDGLAAMKEADDALERYKQRFDESSSRLQQARCKHVFGFDGRCAGCGIDVAHVRPASAAE